MEQVIIMEKYKDEFNELSTCEEDCPILYALNLIGKKWKLPILWNLRDNNALHYNQLKRKVTGITNTMLTKSLKELESDGLVLRQDFKTIPPSVEYKLTKRGEELIPALRELYYWGKKQQEISKTKDSKIK